MYHTHSYTHTRTHTNIDLPDNSIRLFGGSNDREGSVEILINGKWGRICSTGWENVDGQVACGELGLGTNSVGTSG